MEGLAAEEAGVKGVAAAAAAPTEELLALPPLVSGG